LRSRYLGRESLVDFAMDFEGAKLTASVPGVFLPKPGTVLWLMIRRDRCFRVRGLTQHFDRPVKA
jgi:iron(III) transport system ATP-binding protein